MSVPNPSAFRAIVEQAREMLTHRDEICGQFNPKTGQTNPMCLECTWDWCYPTAHERTVTDEVKVMTGGASDPTYTAVAAKRRLRSTMEYTANTLRAVTGLEDSLMDAMEKANPHGEENRYSEGTRETSLGNIEESRRKKRERERRGEGWGSG